MTELNLEVGKYYKNKGGQVLKITTAIDKDDQRFHLGWRFLDENGNMYTQHGGANSPDFDDQDFVECVDRVPLVERTPEERLEKGREGFIADLGYIAATGQVIRAIKMYRMFYGVDLAEAKQIIGEAAALAKQQYHFPQRTPVSNDKALREWVAQEIRLAMQQDMVNPGRALDRAGIADVRAARILAKIDHMPSTSLITVPQEQIELYAKSILRRA